LVGIFVLYCGGFWVYPFPSLRIAIFSVRHFLCENRIPLHPQSLLKTNTDFPFPPEIKYPPSRSPIIFSLSSLTPLSGRRRPNPPASSSAAPRSRPPTFSFRFDLLGRGLYVAPVVGTPTLCSVLGRNDPPFFFFPGSALTLVLCQFSLPPTS